MDYFSIAFRWFHIVWGIMWIGLLYFFNFVNGPFAATMDADTKKKVVPELMPRALFWFRWGAAYTWLTGFFLLYLVYGYSHLELSNPAAGTGMSHALLFSFLLAPFIYDMLAKSPLAKNPKVFAAIGFVLICGVIYMAHSVFDFGYRGYVIYIGAMLGSIMAYNVWFRIWPNQKKIITGIKTGVPADASLVAVAGTRSKHNTYLSVPLIWTMINAHSAFGVFSEEYGWLILCGVVALGWMITMQLYKRAGKVKGF